MDWIHAHFLCLLLALFVLAPAEGWSGANAYTLVILTSINEDQALWNVFYNAPAGTGVRIALHGYHTLDAFFDANVQLGTLSTFDKSTPPSMPFSPQRSPLYTTSLLSSEWVVLEVPALQKNITVVNRSTSINFGQQSTLLHCRLPLPQDGDTVASLVTSYLKLKAPSMRGKILTWWTGLAHRYSSQCIYGDGEGPMTGTPRYYEICPFEGVYRIKKGLLLRAMEETSRSPYSSSAKGTTEASDSYSTQATKKKEPRNVLDILKSMHASAFERQKQRSDPRIAMAFERVGQYHDLLSSPRWNPVQRAWEMLYPSTEPCDLHVSNYMDAYRTHARANQTNKERYHHEGFESVLRQDNATIGVGDAYWKTVIRLRCPTNSQANHERFHERNFNARNLRYWSISELRQTCCYQVEIETTIVCDWERELDSLAVNPIPCVELK